MKEKKKEITKMLKHPHCSNKNCYLPTPEILNRLHKESKLTWKQLADIFETSERTIRRHARQSDKEKQKIKLRRGRKRKIEGKDLDFLRFYAIFYTLTFRIITQKFLAGSISWCLRKQISQATICRSLREAKVTCKKFTFQALEQLREENKEKIKHFIEVTLPRLLKSNVNVFFLDECSFHLNAVPRRGYYLKGSRLVTQKLGNKGKNHTFIFLTQVAEGEKVIHSRLIEGGLNSEKFHEFLTEFNPPNNGKTNYLIMDNLSVHRAKDSCLDLGLTTIEELLRSKNTEIIFLPPYTPELNLVEKIFNITRKHVESKQARRTDKLELVLKEKMKFFQGENMFKYLDNSVKECLTKLASTKKVYDSKYKFWITREEWESYEVKESCRNFTITKRINAKIDLSEWA